MNEEYTINIPESLYSYRYTIIWNLTPIQAIIFIINSFLLIGSLYCIVNALYLLLTLILLIMLILIFGLFEIQGKNFYSYVFTILKFYLVSPKVMIFHHFNREILSSENFNVITQNKKSVNLKIYFLYIFMFLLFIISFIFIISLISNA